MSVPRFTARLTMLMALPAILAAQPASFSFDDAQQFLKTHCQACHQGSAPAGGFPLQQIAGPTTIRSEAERWNKVALRVHNGEMPPKGFPVPPVDQREQFAQWVTTSVRKSICGAGATPGPAPIRRLNRDEYAATLRDLLDIQVDLTSSLPADGAGGEGFDNAGETLFLSPLLFEKYLQAAKVAMDVAGKEFKSREKILVARPGNGVTSEQAAHEILKAFLPRAFRRPVTEDDVAQYLALFRAARKQGQEFEPAILFTLRATLVSPRFLFLAEPLNNTADLRPIDPYSLARQLDTDKAPDAKLFPAWSTDEELRSDIRLQPAIFFHEILKRDLSVLSLIDSNSTVLTRKLVRHFAPGQVQITGDSQQPQWIDLPKGSTRGGLLGMPAVLAVSSYPYRTSPVLRGAWILESEDVDSLLRLLASLRSRFSRRLPESARTTSEPSQEGVAVVAEPAVPPPIAE